MKNEYYFFTADIGENTNHYANGIYEKDASSGIYTCLYHTIDNGYSMIKSIDENYAYKRRYDSQGMFYLGSDKSLLRASNYTRKRDISLSLPENIHYMFTGRLNYTKHDNLVYFYDEKEEDIILFRSECVFDVIFDKIKFMDINHDFMDKKISVEEKIREWKFEYAIRKL